MGEFSVDTTPFTLKNAFNNHITVNIAVLLECIIILCFSCSILDIFNSLQKSLWKLCFKFNAEA